jgi:hypothetical protein
VGFFNVAGGVAIFAHIGGFIIGMIIALTTGLNRKKKLKTKFELKKRVSGSARHKFFIFIIRLGRQHHPPMI